MPHLYTQFREASTNGTPVFRPLFMAPPPTVEATTAVHPAVAAATRLLEATGESAQGLTLEALARRCGVSRRSLTASFRAHGASARSSAAPRPSTCVDLNAELGRTREKRQLFGPCPRSYTTNLEVAGGMGDNSAAPFRPPSPLP